VIMMRSEWALPPIADVIAAFPAGSPACGVEPSIGAIGALRPAIFVQSRPVRPVGLDIGNGEGRRPRLCAGMYFPAASRKLFKIISKKFLESVKSDALADSPA
jgi:hypothetical protein